MKKRVLFCYYNDLELQRGSVVDTVHSPAHPPRQHTKQARMFRLQLHLICVKTCLVKVPVRNLIFSPRSSNNVTGSFLSLTSPHQLAVDKRYHAACPKVLYRANDDRQLFSKIYLDQVDQKHLYIAFKNQVGRAK